MSWFTTNQISAAKSEALHLQRRDARTTPPHDDPPLPTAVATSL